MSKNNYNLLDEDESAQQPFDILKKKKLENVYYSFDDLKKKWSDKCYDQKCVYGNEHQFIKAISVKLNDIKIRNDVKNLSIYATKEIILDKDVTFNSGSITVIAPTIKMPYEVKIDLSGKDGLGYNSKAKNGLWQENCVDISLFNLLYLASNIGCEFRCNYNPQEISGGTRGENGLDGVMGNHGGNFTAIAQKYDGINNLKISVNGGNGGNGQDGGDGGGCHNSYLTAPMRRSGGNGGDAGNSGSGGKKGVVQIYQQQQDLAKSYVSNNVNSSDGKDGAPGKYGKGGDPWKGCLYQSGKSGENGSFGKIIKNQYQQKKLLEIQDVKKDYFNFMQEYAKDAYEHPEDYSEIVGNGINFNSFIQ